jgi:hypothetical protein
MRKILISAALISAASMAAPAAAQYGDYNRGNDRNYGYDQGRNIEHEIDQIKQRIDRAARRGTISRSEANRLFRRADQLDRLADRYRRNGLSPREHDELQRRVQDLRQQLRFERRDDWRDDRRDDRRDRWDD